MLASELGHNSARVLVLYINDSALRVGVVACHCSMVSMMDEPTMTMSLCSNSRDAFNLGGGVAPVVVLCRATMVPFAVFTCFMITTRFMLISVRE